MSAFDIKALAALRARVEERRQRQLGLLAEGGAEDFADYRFQCGALAALAHVLDDVEEIRKAMLEG